MEFKELKIIEQILKSLENEGYTTPTPIQKKAIPLLLEGRDVIGIAQTGTGKTASFTVPVLQKLHESNSRSKNPRALILAPTRELAAQISDSFKTYGRFLNLRHTVVFGGVPINAQIRNIRHGIDILIATPGRLLDLMSQKKVSLEEVEFLVLDEADRMLDMGFLKDVKKIASAISNNHQSLFFSATLSREIANLARDFLKNPAKIEVSPQATPVERIEQCVFFIDQKNKSELLLDLISQNQIECGLVFVGAKYKADRIAKLLRDAGIPSDALHGNKSQFQRTRALENFKKGKIKVLIATDIAARGIDVENITHVINYDIPNESENYVHRIGRTARAGTSGVAYSFCAAEERNYLHQVERKTKTKIPLAEHKYHSEAAKNAIGASAKPKPRGRRSQRRGDKGNNNSRLEHSSKNTGHHGRSGGHKRPRSDNRTPGRSRHSKIKKREDTRNRNSNNRSRSNHSSNQRRSPRTRTRR